MMKSGSLAREFRVAASVFRQHALESVAIAYERCAQRVEEIVADESEQLLSLREASAMSGYSADHLGRLIREDTIPNAGRKGSPRIMRQDLPMKPGIMATAGPKAEVDLEQIVRSVIDEGVG